MKKSKRTKIDPELSDWRSLSSLPVVFINERGERLRLGVDNESIMQCAIRNRIELDEEPDFGVPDLFVITEDCKIKPSSGESLFQAVPNRIISARTTKECIDIYESLTTRRLWLPDRGLANNGQPAYMLCQIGVPVIMRRPTKSRDLRIVRINRIQKDNVQISVNNHVGHANPRTTTQSSQGEYPCNASRSLSSSRRVRRRPATR